MNTFSLKQDTRGLAFTRLCIAAALAKEHPEAMEATGRRLYGAESLAARVGALGGMEMLAHEKAAVAAGGRISGNWAQVLAETESASSEFFSLVRDRSLLGRLPGLRRVPLRVRMIGMETGFTAAWVGEGAAVPVSSATFDEDSLDAFRVAAMAVVTQELLDAADSAAETLIRDDLAGAVAEAINVSMLDPNNSGTPGIQPVSLTNGAPSVNATGDGLADIRLLTDVFLGDLETAVLVGSANSFLAMHDPVYLPGLGVRGGNAIGIPAIASKSAGSTLTLIDPAGVAYGDGEVSIRIATQATIEMVDNPTGNAVTPTGASVVSLWQANSVAIMANATVNWQAARPSVATLEGVAQS